MTPTETTDTGLSVITSAEQFNTTLARLQQQYHVLTPFTSLGGLAPQYAIFASVVQINTDKAAGEVYDGMTADGRNVLQFLKPGEVALAKNGLRKIAEGLGISIHLEYLSDGGAIRHFYHVKAVAAYRGADGGWMQRQASESWDLRDGSERMRGWTPNQIAEGRKHGLRQCETRAINAAIRECGAGVKQAYRRDELAKPFLAFRVNFVPDMTDPEQRRAVTERALQGAAALYSGTGALPAAPIAHGDAFPEALQHGTPEPVPVGRSATTAASAPAPIVVPTAQVTPQPAKPAADAAPNPNAVKIAAVSFKDGKNENTGRAWRKYIVVDSTGTEYSTFEKLHFDDAVRFKDANAWVEIRSEGGRYNNVIEIVKAEPHLPGLDEV